MHVIAAKAVCFKEALSPEFQAYGRQVVANAKTLSQVLTDEGISIVSGGTDNHLMLMDLSRTEVSGKEMQNRLELANITANRNTIPNDPRSAFVTSGVRLGTPAVTTRGFKEADMEIVGRAIAMTVKSEENIQEAGSMIRTLTEKYPLEG